MTPNLSAQFRRPALDLTAGLHGYRIAFIGGPVYTVVAEYPTLAQAGAAYKAAKLAADQLDAICRTTVR